MGTSQKYSLRWNDFSLNVATTFRDLHSQQVSNKCYHSKLSKSMLHKKCHIILKYCMIPIFVITKKIAEPTYVDKFSTDI